MIDRLAAVRPRVDDDPIAVAQLLLLGDTPRRMQQMPQQRLVIRRRQRSHMLLRNHQHMHRSLWPDVQNGKGMLILKNLLCGNRTVSNLAEEAVHTLQHATFTMSSGAKCAAAHEVEGPAFHSSLSCALI